MYAGTIGTCAELLVIISNMSLFLAATALLHLLLVVILTDLIVLAT